MQAITIMLHDHYSNRIRESVSTLIWVCVYSLFLDNGAQNGQKFMLT